MNIALTAFSFQAAIPLYNPALAAEATGVDGTLPSTQITPAVEEIARIENSLLTSPELALANTQRPTPLKAIESLGDHTAKTLFQTQLIAAES